MGKRHRPNRYHGHHRHTSWRLGFFITCLCLWCLWNSSSHQKLMPSGHPGHPQSRSKDMTFRCMNGSPESVMIHRVGEKVPPTKPTTSQHHKTGSETPAILQLHGSWHVYRLESRSFCQLTNTIPGSVKEYLDMPRSKMIQNALGFALSFCCLARIHVALEWAREISCRMEKR